MTEWKKIKISDIAEVIGGGTPSTKQSEYWGNDIPWLTPKDLSGYDKRYISNGERNISNEGLKNSSARMLPVGSILLTSRAPIGYLAIAEQDLCTNQGFKSLVLKPGNDSEFFYYLLKNNIEYIKNMSSGSTFAEISGSQIKKLEFDIPDCETQQKIAKVLGAIDDKIELNNSINNNLEQQAQAIFKSWFVDSDYEIEKETTIGKICKCELGGTPSRNKEEYWNGSIAWINSGAVNNYRITKATEYITELGLSKSATKLLPKKTTVLAITGATLGQISLLEIDSCANQSVVGILENDILPYEFIYPYISHNIHELLSHQTGGAQQHINKQNIEQLAINLPKQNAIVRYKTLVAPIYSNIANNCFENEHLTQLRDTLLPKLMSGEIDVSGVNIEEKIISTQL